MKPIKRESKEYELLIDELYISAVQNPLYRNILLNCNKTIIHSIGEIIKKKLHSLDMNSNLNKLFKRFYTEKI